VRVLLDTHTLIWWANDHPRLSKNARAVLESFDSKVFVSAVSAWELTTKVRLGKLPESAEFSEGFTNNVERLGFYPLAITLDHGQRAGLLPGPHKDPFDRLLIAQSLAENMPIISNEEIFDAYTVRRIW
jgi:PIN domain nuclease of toxin-antitoxin system